MTTPHTKPAPTAADYTRIVDDLTYHYDGVFNRATVQRAVDQARAILEPVSKIPDFLPILTERFARDQLLAAAQDEGKVATGTPEILFVCVHNSGRSQMAAALARHLSVGKVHVRSAGSQPDQQIHPLTIQALAERGNRDHRSLPQTADRRRRTRRGRDRHHGLRRRLPRHSRQALRTGVLPTQPANPSRWSGRSETTSTPESRPCSAKSSTSPDKHPFSSKGAHTPMADKPSVLFVCVHNAGRSQMAAGFLTHLGGGQVEVRSAGSIPGDQVNPSAVAAMAEVGIDISGQSPKVLTTDAVQASDVVITMGCGDACPIFPGKRYLDWSLADPAGQGVEAVRPIRDEIKARVQALLAELLSDQGHAPAASR